MSVLSLQSVTLTASLPGGSIAVLRDVDIEVSAGEMAGLVGESGAGKSMIGRIISGLLPPGFEVTRGRVMFDGRDLLRETPRARRELLGRRISFIPQEPMSALNPVRTIGDQFNEHLSRLRIPRADRRALAVNCLDQVGLVNAADIVRRYPHQLSGGQCQRVLIAMAFSGKPALVVADEPTTALDVVTQAKIVRLIADQQALHNTAVLLITHDLKLAAHVCKTVSVMYAGDMVEAGPASVVLGAPSHPYTRSLLAAVPTLAGPRRVLPALADLMPGFARFSELDGCRFAPRCPVKDDACRGKRVAPRMIGDRHWTRCSRACSEFRGTEGEVLMAASAFSGGSAPAAVELRDVSLTYRSSGGFLGLRQKSFEAVKAVTFSARRGEMLGIVGESGSGKSSIARLIVGLEHPSSGTVHVNGNGSRKIAHLTRRDAQMIFQDPQSALNPRRSVLRLLTQAMEVGGPGRSPERLEIAGRLLKETGLPEDCLHRFPSELSGGQKQRVNIGRAICVMPEVVVADEIVSGLDVSIQAHILNLLLDLNRRHGITVILISHDLAVVRYLCPRSLIMYRGEIVEEGLTDEIFGNPRHPYTRTLLAAVPQETLDMNRPAFATTAAQ